MAISDAIIAKYDLTVHHLVESFGGDF